jgi:hypothetical protein
MPQIDPAHLDPETSPDGAIVNTPQGWLIDAQGNRFSLVRSDDNGLQIRINAFVDAITANVRLMLMDGGRCYQWNAAGDWYGYNGQPGAWEGPLARPSPPDPPKPPITDGVFSVQNGRVLDPNGNPWRGRGINVRHMNWPDNQNSVIHHAIADQDACNPLSQTFPDIDFVRYDAFESMPQFGQVQPDVLIPYIDAIINQGIVCEVECHVFPTVLSGNDLDQVCGWYASLAAHYKDQPLVIWGTQNEPGGPPDNEIRRIYQAIRGAGNNNLIMCCINGGWTFADMNPANYSDMHGVVWDIHYYGWLPNYAMDQGTVDRKLQEMVDQGMSYTSRDGPIPSICGEFSPCGFQGSNAVFVEDQFWMDPNGLQVIDAVYRNQNLCGWTQWYWNTPETTAPNGIGHLLKLPNLDGSSLTEHGGVQCRDAIGA